jgi:hypothetical protein
MALKLPKLPKFKKPKLPKLKAPKLPKLKAPKMPKMPSALRSAGTATMNKFRAISSETIFAVLFVIPIIMSLYVIFKSGFFGVGPYLGFVNILSILLAMFFIYINIMSFPGMMDMMMNIGVLVFAIAISSYAVYVANNLPVKEETKEEPQA